MPRAQDVLKKSKKGKKIVPVIRFAYDEGSKEVTVETQERMIDPVLVHDDGAEVSLVEKGRYLYSAKIVGWSGYIVASG